MPKYYGSKNRKNLPLSYNQSTSLITTFSENEIASGQWTAAGFLLKSGSSISKRDSLRSNFGVVKIWLELKKDKLFIENGSDYYILKEDIYLPSASAAARLVHGNDRNGLTNWRNSDGIPLGNLLYQ